MRAGRTRGTGAGYQNSRLASMATEEESRGLPGWDF